MRLSASLLRKVSRIFNAKAEPDWEEVKRQLGEQRFFKDKGATYRELPLGEMKDFADTEEEFWDLRAQVEFDYDLMLEMDRGGEVYAIEYEKKP